MPGPVVDILMYHSISRGEGPTRIAPDIFQEQMEAIAAAGVPVVTLDDLAAARSGGTSLPERSLILTFDDAFADFAETAWPIMKRHGFHPIVYVPTGLIGSSTAQQEGPFDDPLMDWQTIRDLAGEGVMFGSHSVSHPDLTGLAPDQLRDELHRSRDVLEDQIGAAVHHFAPPYGSANSDVRARIGEIYRTSVSTVLAAATDDAPLIDLPRIEMFYYTNRDVWRRHLAGRGGNYLRRRRVLRDIRAGVRRVLS